MCHSEKAYFVVEEMLTNGVTEEMNEHNGLEPNFF